MSRSQTEDFEDDLYADPDDEDQYFEDEDEELEGRGPRGSVLLIVLVLAFLAEAAIVWFAFDLGYRRGIDARVDTVPPASLAGKSVPEETGGRAPQETGPAAALVTGTGTDGEPTVTAPAEEPIEVPQTTGSTQAAAAQSAEQANTQDTAGDTALQTPAPVESLDTEAANGTTVPAPSASTAAAAEVQASSEQANTGSAAPSANGAPAQSAGEPQVTVPRPPESLLNDGEPQTAAGPPVPSAVAEGDFVVQVAAFPSDEEANAFWNGLQDRMNGLLDDYSQDIQVADVRGTTYHRLRIGYFETTSAANALCTELKARDQDCLVRRR